MLAPFFGGENPTITPVVFCFCWLDHIPAAKMPFWGKKKKSKPRNDRTIKSKGNTEFLHLLASSWLHTSEQRKNE